MFCRVWPMRILRMRPWERKGTTYLRERERENVWDCVSEWVRGREEGKERVCERGSVRMFVWERDGGRDKWWGGERGEGNEAHREHVQSSHPCSSKRMYLPIMIDPLFAGERKPMAAKTMRKKAQIISCKPVPTITCGEREELCVWERESVVCERDIEWQMRIILNALNYS